MREDLKRKIAIYQEAMSKKEKKSTTSSDKPVYTPGKGWDFGVDNDYIKSFTRDAQSFIDDSRSAYSKMGVSNAQNSADTFAKRRDELEERAKRIKAYARTQKNTIPAETATALSDLVTSYRTSASELTSAYESKVADLAQFKTDEDYKKAVQTSEFTAKYGGNTQEERAKRLNALKVQRAEGGKMAGDDTDLDAEIDFLENYGIRQGYDTSAEYDKEIRNLINRKAEIEQYYIDGEPFTAAERQRDETEINALSSKIGALQQKRDKLRAREDAFAPYQQYISSSDYNEGSKYVPSGSDIHTYINSDAKVQEQMRAEEKGQQYAQSQGNSFMFAESKYHDYDLMDEEEKALYNYLYTHERAKANEFLTSLSPILAQRRNEEVATDIAEIGYESPFTASMLSLGSNVISGAAGLTSILTNAASLGNVDIPELDRASAFTSGARAGAGQKASEALDFDIPVIQKNAGEFVYGSLMSLADMGIALGTGAAIGGADYAGKVTQFIMSSEAAANAVYSAHKDGLSGIEVAARGVLAGAVEAITEKYSIDRILGDPKGIIKGILTQAFTEGTEEGAATLLNTAVDTIASEIFGHANEIEKATYKLMEEGMTAEEASREALNQYLRDFGTDVLAGAMTGAMMGGGKEIPASIADATIKSANKKNAALQLEKLGETGDVKKISKALAKQEAGEKLSKAESKALSESKYASEVSLSKLVTGKYNVSTKDGGGYDVSVTSINGTTEAIDVADMDVESPEAKIVKLGADKSMTPATVQTLLNTYDGKANVTDFVEEAEYVYAMGKAGIPKAQVSRGAGLLSSSAREMLYEDGAQYAIEEKRKITEAYRKLRESTSGVITAGSFDTSAIKGMKLNASQERYVRVAEGLSNLGFNIKIVRNVSTNKNASGSYNPDTNVIEVNIDAATTGDLYKKARANFIGTLNHEITHQFERSSPEEYAAFSEVVLNAFDSSGDLDSLLNDEVRRLRDTGRYDNKTDGEVLDIARRELVARASENMLRDSDAIKRVLEENRTIGEKIIDIITKFVDKLRALLEDLKGDKSLRKEALLLEDMVDFYEEAKAKWSEAFAATVANVAAKNEIVGKGETLYTADGTPILEAREDGTIMFNEATYEEEGREKLRVYLEKQVKSKKLSKEDAADILDSLEDIYETIHNYRDKYAPYGAWAEAKVIRDGKGKPVFSVVTPNGEYKMNIDFSLVCKKRRMLDAVFNRMIKRGIIDDFNLGKEEIVQINNIIKSRGFEIACALCFVDAKRFRQAGVADSFVDIYNRIVNEITPEGVEVPYFNFGGNKSLNTEGNGLAGVKVDNSVFDRYIAEYGAKSVEGRVAKHLKNNPGDRKLLSRGDFLSTAGFDAVRTQKPAILKLFNAKKGSGGPKSAFSDTQYLNEIIDSTTFNVKKAFSIGGVRVQSFSDYVARLVFDYCQMVADLAAKQLPAHAYSKEDLFVKQFGKTGIKINMSLIPKVVDGGVAAGLDADGNYAWADESFDFETAKKIQDADGYTDNCGTICVGVSTEHILKLLDDPDIRMVIPYHKSGLNPIVAKLNKIDGFTDYTNSQNTRYTRKDGTPGAKLEKADLKTQPNVNELLQNGMDAKAAADEYLAWCDKNGYTPKFDEFRTHENYYKLLIDFVAYNKYGEAVPQGAVKMNFPTDADAFGSMAKLIDSGLKADAVTQYDQDKALDPIVDEIEKALGSGETMYSEETEYNTLINKAVEYFGTTTDFNEAGFILPSGEMLRLTDDFHRGERKFDHRAIGLAYGVDVSLAVNNGYNAESNKHLDDFVDNGSIRFYPGDLEFNHGAIMQLSKKTPLTREQEQTIRDFITWQKQREEMHNPDDYVWSMYDGPLGLHIDFGDTAAIRIDADRSEFGIDFLSYEGGQINADRIIADIRHFYNTGETRQASLISQFHTSYSEETSHREALSDALAEVTMTDKEAQILERYRARAKTLDSLEKELNDVNAELKKLSFGKGKRDTARISELKGRKAVLESNIQRADKKLLELEGTKMLKDVLLRREKQLRVRRNEAVKKARAEAKAKSDAELLAAIEQGRENTRRAKEGERIAAQAEISDFKRKEAEREYERRRRNARNTVKERANGLVSYILHQTDQKNVKEGVKGAALEFLRVILKDTGMFNPSEMRQLRNAYANLEKTVDVDAEYSGAYDFDIMDDISALEKTVSGRAWRDLTLDELEKVNRVIANLRTMIRKENKIFRDGRADSRTALAEAAKNHMESSKVKKSKGTIDKLVVTDNVTPVYFFKRIGGVFEKLFNDIVNAQNTAAMQYNSAKLKLDELKEKYNFKKWYNDKATTITTESGEEFRLSAGQAMYLYAVLTRETMPEAKTNHLRGEGIVTEEAIEKISKKNRTKENIVEKRIPLTDKDIGNIVNTLTDEQKNMADEMVKYLSEDMSILGNQVSMELFGIKKYNEQYYIPLKVASQYRYKSTVEDNSGELKSGTPTTSLKHMSSSNRLQKGASNPIVAADIFDVWAEHVIEMSNYNAFVLPIEAFQSLLNYKYDSNERGRTLFKTAYGENALKYLETFVRDLNGGAVSIDKTGMEKLVALQKKSAVAASVSVWVQQLTSILRAMVEIDPKYLVAVRRTKFDSEDSRMKLWDLMKKYAPGVVVTKEMGRFDIGSGASAREFINPDKRTQTLLEKGEKLVNIADDFLAKPAEFGDIIAWMQIWKACEAEIRDTTDLSGETFYTAVGKRFTDVINKTQVYDSVISRSGHMRNKSPYAVQATAFKAEPTLTLNILLDAVRSGNAKKIARATSVFVLQTAVNAALVSLIYAARDDDEDKTYGEKYVARLMSKSIDELTLLSGIPHISDIVTLLKGYNVERMELSLVSAAAGAFLDVLKEDAGVKEWIDFGTTITDFAGIPAKNILRDAKIILNFFKHSKSDVTAQSIGYAIGDTLGGTTTDKILRKVFGVSFDPNYTGNYLDALEDGNTKKARECYEELIEYKLFKAQRKAEAKGEKFNRIEAEKDAKSSLQSKLTSTYKNAYIEAYKRKDFEETARIRGILRRSGLYKKSISDICRGWLKDN